MAIEKIPIKHGAINQELFTFSWMNNDTNWIATCARAGGWKLKFWERTEARTYKEVPKDLRTGDLIEFGSNLKRGQTVIKRRIRCLIKGICDDYIELERVSQSGFDEIQPSSRPTFIERSCPAN